MVEARARRSESALLSLGSRWAMTTKAMPLSVGIAWKKRWKASSPRADTPRPTIRPGRLFALGCGAGRLFARRGRLGLLFRPDLPAFFFVAMGPPSRGTRRVELRGKAEPKPRSDGGSAHSGEA